MEVNKHKENAKMGSELGPDWSNMTWDCLIDIFSRLSIEQRWFAPMLACKTWLNVCKDPSLNSVFDLEAWFLSSTESSFWWSSEFAEKVDSFLISVVQRSEGSLTEIRVRHCTDRALLYVADSCPNLEVLWVKQCPKVTDKSMTTIALKCHKIKELDISQSYGISRASIFMVGGKCKKLQIMKRNFVHPVEVFLRFESFESYMNYISASNLEGIDVLVIARHMQQLKHLELQFSTMDNTAFHNICKRCPDLEYLDLFGCGNLTSNGVSWSTSLLKNLKVLIKPNFAHV